MDSLSGKINALKENLVGLFMDMSNTDFIKGGISGINDLVSGVRTLIDTFGALPVSLATCISLMTIFNKKTREFAEGMDFGGVTNWSKNISEINTSKITDLSNEITKVKNSFKSGSIGANEYGESMISLRGKMVGLKLSMIGARLSAIALNAALSFGVSFVIGELINLGAKAIDSIHKTKKEIQEANEEITTNFSNNVSDIKKSEELLAKVDITKQKIGNTQDLQEQNSLKKELIGYEESLAQILPASSTAFSEQGKAISNNTEAVRNNILQKKRQAEDDARNFVKQNKDFSKHVEGYIQGTEKIAHMEQELRRREDENKNLPWYKKWDTKGYGSNLNDEKEKIKDYSKEINEMIKIKNGLDSIGSSKSDIANIIGQDNIDAVEKYNNSLSKTNGATNEAGHGIKNASNQVNDLAEAMEKGEKQAKEYADSFSKLGGNVEIAKKALQEMTKYGKLSNDTVASILNSGDTKMISSLGNKANFVKNMTEAMKDSEKQQKQSYDNAVRLAMATESQKNTIAQNGANQRGQISADEVNKKGALDQQDANNQGNSEIAKNNNAINGNNSRNQIEANGVNTKNGLYNNDSSNQGVGENNKVSNTSGAVNSIVSMSADMTNVLGSNYSADASNFSRALNQKLAAISQYVSNASRMLSSVLGFSTGGYFGKMVDQVKESMMPTSGDSSYDPIDAGGGFEPVSYSPVGYSNDKLGGSGSGKKKKGSKSKKPKSSSEKVDIKDIEEEVDRYKSLQDALDDVNNELERNNQLKDLAQGSDKLKYMREENSLYIEKKKAIHDLINAKKQEARELEGILNSNGFDAVNGDISNYQSKLNQIKNEANSMANSNKKKEDAIKRYKKLEEQANKYFDLTSKELPNLQKEWEDVNKAMKDAEREKVEMIGNAEREMVDVIKENLDKKKELYNKDWDERKKLLDEEYDKKKETLDKETEALKKALQDQKDIMNNQFEDENYKSQLSDKEEELAKLQQQIDEASRNTTLEGQNMLNDLLEQKKKLEEERDKFIKEHQQNMANDLFDKEMDKIDKDSQDKGDKLDDEHKLNSDILDKEKEEREKEWDKHFSAEKISELAKQLVHQGFAEVNGEVLKLGDAVKKYFVSQGEVFSDSSLKLQELMDKIKVAQGLAQDLNNMNKNLGVSSSNNIRTFMNNPNYQPPIASFMALPTIQNNQKPNITINSDLNIGEIKNGQSPDEMQRMFAEHKQDIIKTINRELDNY